MRTLVASLLLSLCACSSSSPSSSSSSDKCPGGSDAFCTADAGFMCQCEQGVMLSDGGVGNVCTIVQPDGGQTTCTF